MFDFVNKSGLSDQKYQTNGIVRYVKYKGKFLFPMKECVLFGKYHQSMYLMSNIFLKDNIYGVYIPQFQLS